MSQISAAATSAREAARSTDGKFGSYSSPEAAGVALDGPDNVYPEDACTCGASLDDGEGFDGLCGSCADAATVLCTECGMDERDDDKAFVQGKCRDCVLEERASAAELEDRWGRNNLSEGSRTPWGQAQHVTSRSAGVDQVVCAGHGGVKLSPARNAAIPAALRNDNGWYEEDCDAYIAAWKHPDGFTNSNDQAILAEIAERGEAGVKDWRPDEYEKATGATVALEDSFVLRQRAAAQDTESFRQAHAHEFVTTGGGHPVYMPEGFEEVDVERRADGDTRTVAVPTGFWKRNGTDRTDTPIVIGDTIDGHVDITAEKEQYRTERAALDRHLSGTPEQPLADLGIDTSVLTERQAARAETELSRLWRTRSGEVKSMRRILEEDDDVYGKAVSFFGNDTASYHLRLGDSHIREVSKATYDSLTGVPETMSATDHTRLEWSRATAAQDRAHARLDVDKWAKAKARVDAAKAAHTQAQADEREQYQKLTAATRARIVQRLAAADPATSSGRD